MIGHQTDTVEREAVLLVGYSIRESLNHVLESRIVRTLREDLLKRSDEIASRIGTGIYLLQIYDQKGEWTHNTPYQHVIAFEVADLGEIPDGMVTYPLPAGKFNKVVHKGPESNIHKTYDFINRTYGHRPIDIEYFDDIHTLESEEGQIDIYFPAR